MIPLTAEERIAEAEKMLRVKSPRMAMLYMELASQELEERRKDRLSTWERLGESIEHFAEVVVKAFSGIAETFQQALPSFVKLEAYDRELKARGINLDEYDLENLDELPEEFPPLPQMEGHK